MFFIPWRGVPTIPARRSLTGSGRRLAASPVLFREIAVFFLANDGARAIGANAASYGVFGRKAPPNSQRPEDGSPPCSLSVISGWRDGVFFIPWRGVPTIPARRSLTGSGRRLAASPVLFREIAVFFLANDGAGVGDSARSAARYGVFVRKAPPDSTARRWVSAVLSLRHFRLARWCVLYPLAGVPTIPARRSLTGSGRLLAASPVLFREIAVFFLANDGARAIGANAASYGVFGARPRPIRNGPKMGLRRALSPSFPAGEMVCSLSLGGGCRQFRRGAV